MGFLSLSTLSKNQFRKFPFKQGVSLRADNGLTLEDGVVIGCSITSVYGKHRLYVRQLFKRDSFVSIAIASFFTDEVLGTFSGEVTENFTTLTLTAFAPYISGSLTLGLLESLNSVPVTLHFEKHSSELEESTIFCYTPPAVTSISDKKGSRLKGDVKFGLLTNITKTTDTVTKTTQFTVSNPSAVFNKADKSTILDNCPNPIIKNINGVTPFPIGGVNNPFAGNDGNIYIVGVSPVVFYGISDTDAQGSVKIQTDNVTLESLCTQKHKLLPPVDICAFTDPLSKNIYYSKPALAAHDPTKCSFERPERDAGSYFESSRPEYYFWPQFVKPEYYELYWKK